MSREILVFCAHPDDEILGVGATIAKYRKEGLRTTTVIASYGELSHPWLRKNIITDVRIKESRKAAELVGAKTVFLGLEEKDAVRKMSDESTIRKIESLIRKHKPRKVFTHSQDDPHPLHKAVSLAVTKAADRAKQKDVYVFDIWNPLNISKRKLPRLYVDVRDTFSLKTKALSLFESQKLQMQLPLTWSVYLKAIKAGFENRSRFAEVFYKIR